MLVAAAAIGFGVSAWLGDDRAPRVPRAQREGPVTMPPPGGPPRQYALWQIPLADTMAGTHLATQDAISLATFRTAKLDASTFEHELRPTRCDRVRTWALAEGATLTLRESFKNPSCAGRFSGWSLTLDEDSPPPRPSDPLTAGGFDEVRLIEVATWVGGSQGYYDTTWRSQRRTRGGPGPFPHDRDWVRAQLPQGFSLPPLDPVAVHERPRLIAGFTLNRSRLDFEIVERTCASTGERLPAHWLTWRAAAPARGPEVDNPLPRVARRLARQVAHRLGESASDRLPVPGDAALCGDSP